MEKMKKKLFWLFSLVVSCFQRGDPAESSIAPNENEQIDMSTLNTWSSVKRTVPCSERIFHAICQACEYIYDRWGSKWHRPARQGQIRFGFRPLWCRWRRYLVRVPRHDATPHRAIPSPARSVLSWTGSGLIFHKMWEGAGAEHVYSRPMVVEYTFLGWNFASPFRPAAASAGYRL